MRVAAAIRAEMLKGDEGVPDKRLTDLAQEVDSEELLELLAAHFGWTQSDPAGGVIYPSMTGPFISLDIDSDGQVGNIKRHRRCSDAEVDAIEAEIRSKLLSGGTRRVHSAIALASMPVTGYYRAPRDVFEIAPAPDDAPRPPVVYGDHPFVFQYWVTPSSDPVVTGHRSNRVAVEWMWFLNAVLTDWVGLASANGGGHRWVWPEHVRGDTTLRPSTWAQEGYVYPGWLPSSELLELGQPLARIPSQSYYGTSGNATDRFELPTSMDATVQLYLDLTPERRRRFLRAAQWLTAAVDISRYHRGSAFIAQVAAIETLAHTEVESNVCPTCGTDLSLRPTGRFIRFVKRYAPGARREDISALYEVRSGLVHGRSLLHHDSPFGQYLSFARDDEQTNLDRIRKVVSAVMFNWLRDPAP